MKYIKTYEDIKVNLTIRFFILLMKNAISEGDLESVKKLLKAGYKIEKSQYLLREASSSRIKLKRNIEIIKELIKYGLDVNYGSPLYDEILDSNPNLEYIKILFDAGANPNYITKYGVPVLKQALSQAIFSQNYMKIFTKILKEFIKNKVDFSLTDSKGEDFLDFILHSTDINSNFKNKLLEFLKLEVPELYDRYQTKIYSNKYNL